VEAQEAIGVAKPERSADSCPEVSSLGGEAVVSELAHETCPKVGDAEQVHAGTIRPVRVAEARQRWDNYVEGVGLVSSVRHRIAQQGENLQHLQEGAWPAVGEDQRDGCRSFAARMDEVDAEAVRDISEMLELGDAGDLGLPVKVPSPVFADFLERLELEAVLPA